MKLRPRYNGHQNVILCHSACSPSGLFLQVNERDTYSYLRSKYPDVENILYLPPPFLPLLVILRLILVAAHLEGPFIIFSLIEK